MNNRSILIMAGETGGHIFGYGITPAALALACTEKMAGLRGAS